MIKIINNKNKNIVLEGTFDGDLSNDFLIKEKYHITEFLDSKKAYMFLGKKSKYTKLDIKKLVEKLIDMKRDYQIDIKTFLSELVLEKEVISALAEEYILKHGKVFSKKTKKKKKENSIFILNISPNGEIIFNDSKKEGEIRNLVKSWQIMPPNILNSQNFADILVKEFHKENLEINVINKKEMEKLGMGLMLGVNRGSEYEPCIVVVDYKGDPLSKEKTIMVGKGIMFDSGGYSLKNSKSMATMKFDMSGVAIIAGAMKLISHNKPKINISIVMPLTDNMIGTKAQTVDAVQTSMSGKTVEIVDTDAEGRLILADVIYYATKNLNATRIIDVATLTGIAHYALGNTYSGVWTTSDEDFKIVNQASLNKNEKVWRMPWDESLLEKLKESPIADYYNCLQDITADATSAAEFLKEFTNNVPFIHFDLAGTPEIDGKPTGAIVKTLANMAELF